MAGPEFFRENFPRFDPISPRRQLRAPRSYEELDISDVVFSIQALMNEKRGWLMAENQWLT